MMSMSTSGRQRREPGVARKDKASIASLTTGRKVSPRSRTGQGSRCPLQAVHPWLADTLRTEADSAWQGPQVSNCSEATLRLHSQRGAGQSTFWCLRSRRMCSKPPAGRETRLKTTSILTSLTPWQFGAMCGNVKEPFCAGA